MVSTLQGVCGGGGAGWSYKDSSPATIRKVITK